MKEQHTRG